MKKRVRPSAGDRQTKRTKIKETIATTHVCIVCIVCIWALVDAEIMYF